MSTGKKSSKIINDFTKGNIVKQIVVFAVPFMLSNLMQVLYTLVDMAIVGQYVGSDGLAAVSNASQPMMFMTMFCIGIATSGQVNISHLIGAGRKDEIKKTIGTMFCVLLILAAVMTCIGIVFSKNILSLLNVQPESYDMAVSYMFVCCAGIVFTFGYNMISAVFRGMGDSRHPFIFIVIASVINIILDIVFVKYMDMGVIGAAAATIIGQAFSFIAALIFIVHNKSEFGFDFNPKSIRIDRGALRELIRLGIPFALQGCAINISMMFVGSLVNSTGYQSSATFGVGIRVDDLINKVTQGVTFAVSSMVGQNYAAGNFSRVRKTVFCGWAISAVCYAVYVLLYFTNREELFSLFTEDAKVIELSGIYVAAIVWNYPAMVIMRGSNGFLQGIGNARISLVFALLDGFVFRILLSYIFGIVMGLELYGFFLGYGLAAYGTGIPGAIYFLSGVWEKRGRTKKAAGQLA
ncbi:MAG: MATE family efflux transporter [Lachnospiraceae bacterium]|nr:MATE family efflux transporter [Lachnospiraceae bacterium]